jgi:hypothetical protein
MVLPDSIFFVFALAERKNEKGKRQSTAVPEPAEGLPKAKKHLGCNRIIRGI